MTSWHLVIVVVVSGVTVPLPPSQIGELEQLLSTSVLELERRTEELQNLQDEAETLREELTFKDHQISELEQAVLREKERASSLEGELQVGPQRNASSVKEETNYRTHSFSHFSLLSQVLLDKLTVEVEKNMRLSSELQEGHSGKQVHTLSATCTCTWP